VLWYFSPVNNNSPAYRKYRKTYLQHLIYRHRDFDVKGLSTRGIYSLEQERVFVNLGLDPQAVGRISSGLIPVISEALRTGDQNIWYHLRNRDATNQKFAIIGSPGSGKTTLLKHITLTYASGSYRHQRPRLPSRTPILLFLRDHAEQITSNPRLTLAQVIHRSLTPWQQTLPSGWFETELRKERCVVLAIGCLNEAGAIQPVLRTRVGKLLLEEVEDTDPQRRRIVAEALVAQRLRRVVRVHERRYIDAALVTHAEYQLFLDEQSQRGRFYQPDHWTGTHFPTGQGRTPVVGVRPTDAEALCDWLTERDRGGHYQVPFAEEGQTYTKAADSALGYWVRLAHGFTCEGITSTDLTNIKMALAYRIADDFINLQMYALLTILTASHAQARDLVSIRSNERDLIVEHDRARMLAGDLDLVEPFFQALAGTLDHNSARELTFSLTNARNLARASAQDLASALEAASASAIAQGQEPTRASAQDQDRARLSARMSDRARASAIAHATTLVSTLTKSDAQLQTFKQALADDFTSNPELMCHFAPADPRTRELLEALAYGKEATCAQLLLHARSHIYIPHAEQFRAFVRSHAFVLDHTHALTCITAFDRTSTERATERAKTALQRAYLRYWALMCSAMITHAANHRPRMIGAACAAIS